MSRTIGSRSPIHNATNNKPRKMMVQPDGSFKEVVLPQNPNRKLMVSPAGNVIWLILSNGAAQRGLNPYGVQKLEEKKMLGFLPYEECPITKGYIRGKKGCEGDDGRGGFKEDKCCKCILKIIEQRKAAHAETTAAYHDTVKSNDDLMRDYMKMTLTEKAQERARGKE
jgi:hypothetical protein